MPVLPRFVLVRAAVVGLAAAGCSGLGAYEAPCFDDSACENGAVCRGGECVIECVVDRECPASAPLCEFNRCTPLASQVPDAGELPDLAPLPDFGGTRPTPDAAAPTSDAAAPAPDAAAPLPDAAAPVPDAAAPVPDAAAPLPDAAAPAPDAAAPLPDAAAPAPDAAAPLPDAAP